MSLTPSPAPALFRALSETRRYLSEELLGGPKVLRFSWVINLQKGGTLPFVLALMVIYQNFSPAAWIYLALHGSYGLCWLLKHLAFRDPGFDTKVTFAGALVVWCGVLGLYWVAPFLLISGILGPGHPQPSSALLAVSVGLHTLGLVIMIAADCQKYFTLRLKPGLITDGMFSRVRHPNYLGEMMLYSAYALLVQHWIPWLILGWVWSFLFVTNMINKEASMSRYPQWAAYKARTGMLLPRLRRPTGDA